MSRAKAITERHVRQQYILVKAHCPNIAPLWRDEINQWYLGKVLIGGTCPLAFQFLCGVRAGLLAAPFLHSKAG